MNKNDLIEKHGALLQEIPDARVDALADAANVAVINAVRRVTQEEFHREFADQLGMVSILEVQMLHDIIRSDHFAGQLKALLRGEE